MSGRTVVVKAADPVEARVAVRNFLQREMRHNVTFQGLAFECFRCGLTAAAHPIRKGSNVYRVLGDASSKVCEVQS